MNSGQTHSPSDNNQPTIKSLDHHAPRACVCFSPDCFAQNSILSLTCHDCGQSLRLQGRYRALREIGQGRFAKTYAAIDEQNGQRLCVIKQFLPKQSEPDAKQLYLAKNLFQQEALVLQRLGTHPQIPDLIAFIQEPDALFLVQEFVPGLSLYQRIKEAPESFDLNVKTILLELLPVLEFIHSHDIIHRDIKLGNIMQSRSKSLWLIDFGAADHKNLGRFGVTGTPGYAAPEQLQGKSCPASDLYSLAVTCLSLVTGQLLDTAESAFHSPDEFLRCLWNQPGHTLSPPLAKVLDGMLQPDLESRYQSASAVLHDLRQLEPQAPVVDYGRLQQLLAEEAYQAADQETWQILLKLSDCLPDTMLTVDAIDRLAFMDLRILDQLWATASEGRFGFGVQLRLFQRQGNIRDFDYGRWQQFANQVGWCSEGKWLDYQDLGFNCESPPGHLPAVFMSLANRQGQPCGPLGWWRLGFMSLMERFALS